jgi:hypothetical protein
LALINKDGKREARITCTEKTHLGVICKHDYDQCLEKIEMEHQSYLLDFIQSIPCFSTISKAGISKIVKSLTNMKCTKGQNITKESFRLSEINKNKFLGNDQCSDQNVYFILSGEFAAF